MKTMKEKLKEDGVVKVIDTTHWACVNVTKEQRMSARTRRMNQRADKGKRSFFRQDSE